jgi:hypothetical protein
MSASRRKFKFRSPPMSAVDDPSDSRPDSGPSEGPQGVDSGRGVMCQEYDRFPDKSFRLLSTQRRHRDTTLLWAAFLNVRLTRCSLDDAIVAPSSSRCRIKP